MNIKDDFRLIIIVGIVVWIIDFLVWDLQEIIISFEFQGRKSFLFDWNCIFVFGEGVKSFFFYRGIRRKSYITVVSKLERRYRYR